MSRIFISPRLLYVNNARCALLHVLSGRAWLVAMVTVVVLFGRGMVEME